MKRKGELHMGFRHIVLGIALLLYGFTAFSGASFLITDNATVNSSVWVNQFFFLNDSACIFDSVSNNSYCGFNNTFYVEKIINNTVYPLPVVINQTVYPAPIVINQTQYPQCANYSNETVNLTYPGFGITAFTNYSCRSGEIVFAPFSNSTNSSNETNSTCMPTIIENSSCPVTYQPVKYEKKLYCNSTNAEDRRFIHIDFDTQQYLDFEVADCSPPVQQLNFTNLSQDDQRTTCQAYYDLGFRERTCPTTSATVVQAGGGDGGEGFASTISAFAVVCGIAGLGYYLYQRGKLPRTQTVEEPADFLGLKQA